MIKKSSALLMFNSARILLVRAIAGNQEIGAVAQLGARLHGMQEVTGSIPVSSTFSYKSLADRGWYFCTVEINRYHAHIF